MTQTRTRLLLGPRQTDHLLNALSWAIESFANPDIDGPEERAVLRAWKDLRHQIRTERARANVRGRRP